MESDLDEVNYNSINFLTNNGLQENVEYNKKQNRIYGSLPQFESPLSKQNKKSKTEEMKHHVNLLGHTKSNADELICYFWDKKCKAVCDLK